MITSAPPISAFSTPSAAASEQKSQSQSLPKPSLELQTGNFNIHSVHWSTVLLGASSVISLIVFVAGIALSQMPLALAGGFYLLVSLVGTYYTQTFSKYKSLESENIMIRQQLNVLSRTTAKLEQETIKVDKVTSQLAEIQVEKRKFEEQTKATQEEYLERISTLTTRIRSITEQAKITLEDNQKSMIEKVSHLATVKEGLEKTVAVDQAIIKGLERTCEDLNNKLAALNSDIEKQKLNVAGYDQENDELRAEIVKLKQNIETLTQVSDNFGTKTIEELTIKLTKAVSHTRTEQEKIAKLEKLVKNLLGRLKEYEDKRAQITSP